MMRCVQKACMLRRWMLCIAVLASALPKLLFAQTPAPLPSPPNLFLTVEGTVRAIARQANGGVIIGGDFTMVNGYGRGNIARLQPDGALDLAWNPSANGLVSAIAIDPVSGAVYVGGSFSVIGARSRANLAKLSGSGTGAADASWNPSTNSYVGELVLDNSGNVYAAGEFTSVGGQSRKYIAKLSGSGVGAVDASWDPSANNAVYALALDGSGNVYVGGWFTSIGGQNRSCIAKLSGSGTGVADASWNPSANSGVVDLILDGSGNVYVGGYFTTLGAQSHNRVARLLASGAADAGWTPSADDYVRTVVLDGGYVYAGGNFTAVGGQSRNHIARVPISGVGAVDAAWNPSATSPPSRFSGEVWAVAADGGGNVYAGGEFTAIGGQARQGFAVLSSNGSATGIVADAERMHGSVHALARQPDGGTIVGGYFRRANNLLRSNILRLRPDGSVDPDWNPPLDDDVDALATDGNGNVYAAGWFTSAGGFSRHYIAKLSGSGTGAVDAAWNPSTDNIVWALAADGVGNVYAGGAFSVIGGQNRNRIARLSGSGSGAADAGWNPSALNGDVYALALDGSGNVFAGGYFTYMGGLSRNKLAKMSISGSGAVDASWNPSPNYAVYALAVDNSGNIYAGGNFTSIGAQARNYIAKLSVSTGAVDASWNPSANTYTVRALALDGLGDVYTGGDFYSIGGQSRSGIAKLSASGGGAADLNWNPSAARDDFFVPQVFALAADSNGNVFAGGNFTTIGGQSRVGLALLPGDGDRIFYNGFE